MFLGLDGLDPTTLWLAIVAAAMVALNLYILYRLLRGPSRPELSTIVLGGAILLSQLVFWIGVAYYLESPTDGGFTIFALATQFMMVPLGLWFVTLVFQESENQISTRSAWPMGLTLLLFGNELAMSWTFAALVPGTLPARIDSLTSAGSAILASLSSLWYFWPMGVSMLVLVRWSRLGGEDRRAVYALSLTAFVAPWAFQDPLVGAVCMAAIMGGGVYILWRGMQFSQVSPRSLYLRAGVGVAFLATSLSWVVSALLLPATWGLAPFAAVMAAVMFTEAYFLIQKLFRSGLGPIPRADSNAAHARSPAGGLGTEVRAQSLEP